ncbi:WG repeat-containing protein [Chitinophaga sp. YIM B06452]|uniref:WG repeat-containing protein n=1 Tax=Chitinophaga sp. YIM B06452 TaxID=3082158 RepID=UPI0031FE8282
MIPWLAKSGLYGYTNRDGSLLIPPQYSHARPFRGGFAVIAQEGGFGIINAEGVPVIAPEHPFIHLTAPRPFSLAFIKKEYNAWWRLPRWRILPEFNLLSTRHNGPLLVTKVPRAQWEVLAMPDMKKIQQFNCTDDLNAWGNRYWRKDWEPARKMPGEARLLTSGEHLLLRQELYNAEGEHCSGQIFGQLEDGTFLQYRKGWYRRVNEAGKPMDAVRYYKKNHLTFGGKTIPQQEAPYQRIAAPVFQSTAGEVFLFPDFSKPFPASIEPYPQVGEVQYVAMIGAMRDAEHFFVLATTGKSKERRLLVLHKSGKWNKLIEPRAGFHSMLRNGSLLFTHGTAKGVMDTSLEFHLFPLQYPEALSETLYAGKDNKSGRYGVFDIMEQDWKVPPAYSYIGPCLAEDIAPYCKDNLYGLMNISTGAHITPPLYDSIGEHGAVMQKNQLFYIDLYTGREYRE